MPERSDRLRVWVQRSETGWGVGLLAFLEALILPVPIEAALVPMMLHRPERRWRFVLWALVGSVAGIGLLYAAGWLFFDTLGARLIALNGWQDAYRRLQAEFAERGAMTVAVVAVTPLPFTLAAIAAGAAKMNVLLFLLVAGATRAVRYVLVALATRLFGDRVVGWLEAAQRDPRARAAAIGGGLVACVVLGVLYLG